MVGTTRPGSTSRERRTNQTPSGNASTSSAATWMARRVLPMPPGPVSVTSRTSSRSSSADERSQLLLTTQQRRGLDRQVVLVGVERLERGEVGGETGQHQLEELLGLLEILEAMGAQVAQRRAFGEGCSTSARVVCESNTWPP